MNCYELMEQSGVSTDLNHYIGFAPDNMVYDKSARTYVPGPKYSTCFLEPDASCYLAQLRSLADGLMDSDDTWIAELPSYNAAPTPARGGEANAVTDAADADWQEHVMLEIGPHPELSENQKKVIAIDYGMRGGKVKIKVRRALLFYALKRLGLDTDPSARKPQDQQFVLLNAAEGIE